MATRGVSGSQGQRTEKGALAARRHDHTHRRGGTGRSRRSARRARPRLSPNPRLGTGLRSPLWLGLGLRRSSWTVPRLGTGLRGGGPRNHLPLCVRLCERVHLSARVGRPSHPLPWAQAAYAVCRGFPFSCFCQVFRSCLSGRDPYTHIHYLRLSIAKNGGLLRPPVVQAGEDPR